MRLPTQGMILEMMFLHRASIHSRLTSHPGEEGHGWVGRLLERVPTGRGVMSTVHKTGTDILSPTPPPLFPTDSCAHGATTSSPRWRLALLAFLPLSLGLAGPVWASGNVSNLNLTPEDGFIISRQYPSALSFTTGNHSAGYTLQSVTLLLKSTNSDNVTVALYSVENGNPGTSLATLSGSRVTEAGWTENVYGVGSRGLNRMGGVADHRVAPQGEP